jgi:hypothetical protein
MEFSNFSPYAIDFPQPLQTNSGTVFLLDYELFLPNPPQTVVVFSLDAVYGLGTDVILKYPLPQNASCRLVGCFHNNFLHYDKLPIV